MSCLFVIRRSEIDGEKRIKLSRSSYSIAKNFCTSLSIRSGGFISFFLRFGARLNIIDIGIICIFRFGLLRCKSR